LDRWCEKWGIIIRVKEQRNILHEISKRKVNWIDHTLGRNCLLQQVIEGKIKGWIEVKGRRGIRRRKLLGDLKETRWLSYLKEEALDRKMWRARFGRGFVPVVRQAATGKWTNFFAVSKIIALSFAVILLAEMWLQFVPRGWTRCVTYLLWEPCSRLCICVDGTCFTLLIYVNYWP
jgi:hypothetical protein